MIRMLIVDDEAPARAKLQRWLDENDDFEIVGEADNGLSAAEQIQSGQPDVVLLDIQMPGMNGLEVASQLSGEQLPLIVFVTAFNEHAIKAFELDAIDYLLKPYDKARFQQTLIRIRARLNVAGGKDRYSHQVIQTARRLNQEHGIVSRLLVPIGGRLQLLEASSVHWLEADDNYVHLHAGVHSYILRRTLQDLLSQLDPLQFVRIHKSAAVNINEIRTLEPLFKGDYELTLHSGTTLRLSRRFRNELLSRLGAFAKM
jgi:two-component system, LytTR family, response regulator